MYSVHHHSKQRLLDPFSTSISGTRLHDWMHSSAVKNASSDHVCGIRWTFVLRGTQILRSMLERFSCTKPILLHMLVGGLFLHYSYAQNTKKKWPSQHFWSLVFRIVFPHLSFAIQTLQLTQWQFQLERPRVDVLSYVWTTSMVGKLRYHTLILMIIHVCKIFNFGLAVFMTSGCLSMIWEIPLQTHAQNMFIDGHIRQEWTQPVGRCRHLGDYGIREDALISVPKDIVKYRFRTNQSLVHGVNPL